MQISIYGIGHVGLIAGVCFANHGHQVACYDVDSEKIEKLQKGQTTFFEPGFDQLLKLALEKGTIKFLNNLEEAISFSSIHFMCVGTPADNDGSSNLLYLIQAVENLANNAKEPFIVVIKSTVPVGTANRVKRKIEEILAKREKEIAFHVVSCPEFLAQGSAIQNFLHPDRVVIGTDNPLAFEKIKEIYQLLVGEDTPILHMSNSSAELTKYASNLFLATKISYMNEISRIAEVMGADIADTIQGVVADKRIGPSMSNPGSGFGGSCLPKDLKSLIHQSEVHNYDPHLLKAVLEVNDHQRRYFIGRILSLFDYNVKDKVIAVWGLSFKAGTDDLRDSISCELVHALLKGNAVLQAYDPKAGNNAKREFKDYSNFVLCDSKEKTLKDADLLIVATDWPEFKELDPKFLKSAMKKPVVIDCRHFYDPAVLTRQGISYFSIGKGFIPAENSV